MPKAQIVRNPSPGIERTEPMKIHKNFIIRHLRLYPEDKDKMIPDWKGSVEDFIEELERRPGEWFVGGILEEHVELCHCGFKLGHPGMCQGTF